MIMLRLLIGICAAAFIGAIFWAIGADDRGLLTVVQEMLRQPWSVVALIDLYLGFLIAAVVIVLFERNLLVALFWALPTFFLGNFWLAAWLIVRLPEIMRRFR